MKKNKYPWIVALILKSDDSHFCGGTLVASKYIVTAAHCMWADYEKTTLLKKNQFQVLKIIHRKFRIFHSNEIKNQLELLQ